MYNILAIPYNLFKWKVNSNVERIIEKYFMCNFNFKPCHLLFGIDFNSKKEKDVDIILNYALFTIYKSFVRKEFKRKQLKRDFFIFLFTY